MSHLRPPLSYTQLVLQSKSSVHGKVRGWNGFLLWSTQYGRSLLSSLRSPLRGEDKDVCYSGCILTKTHMC